MASQLELKFKKLWNRTYPDCPLVEELTGVIPGRRFRFDFAHTQSRVLIEINGGVFMGKSGHSSAKGIMRDYEKNNLAVSNGWVIFQLANKMINKENAELIKKTIDTRLNIT